MVYLNNRTMYNPDTDLIFPSRVIPALKDVRGETWQNLVTNVIGSEEISIAHLAFILLLARLSDCTTCNTDSYRATQGCTACAQQSLKRFKGTDDDLSYLYRDAKLEVEQYLHQKKA